jgi:hypothetical protein
MLIRKYAKPDFDGLRAGWEDGGDGGFPAQILASAVVIQAELQEIADMGVMSTGIDNSISV